MTNGLPTSIRMLVANANVTELQLWFTDILGELDVVKLRGDQLGVLLARGVMPNDSTTTGFGEDAGSDIVAVPDWTTFKRLPATGPDAGSAAVFCSLASMGLFATDQRMLD